MATAAHGVLMGLGRPPVPALPQPVRDWLPLRYAETLAAIPDGPAKDDGIAAGAAAAAAMLASRDGDGRFVPTAFTVGTGPGEWRPTSGVSDPRMGDERPPVHPWRAGCSSPPPGPATRQRCLRPRVQRGQGARFEDRAADPEQQALAEFYQPNPVEMYNRAFRGLTATST